MASGTQAHQGNTGRATIEDPLRFAFVEILFALAVSQVAIYVADLVVVDRPPLDKMPALAHLLVALFLIATSWLGWRRSRSPGMMISLEHIFALRFVGLLMDVSLVVLYFIIVRRVEIEQKGGETMLGLATAKPESFWLCVVFGLYAVWDLATDVFSPDCIPTAPFFFREWKRLRAAFVSTFASVACLILSYTAFVFAATRTGWHGTLFLDGALFSVILLFRALKPLENVFAPLFRVTDCSAWKERRKTHPHALGWGVALALLYFTCLLGACTTS